MYLHYPTLFKLIGLTFSKRYFSPRHAALVIIFVVPFFLLRTFVWMMRKLDYLFFPGFSKQPLTTPLYIIGNPRSGTTFAHRLLARDERFCHLRLYHTIFPSVSCYKIFALLGRMDKVCGRFGNRLLHKISDRGFKGWETIHRTGPEKAESDEMYFMYAMASPLLGLLFPFFKEMDAATFVDFLPPDSREKLMAYYRGCLQRHCYAVGRDKILLQKVALIAGRIRSIHALLPDMRIVHLVRHPYESIPSLISMFDATWKTLAPRVRRDGCAHRELAELICRYYEYLHAFENTLSPENLLRIRYEELVADPHAAISMVYEKFHLQMGAAYEKVLREESHKAGRYRSSHRYSMEKYGLTEGYVRERLRDTLEEYGVT